MKKIIVRREATGYVKYQGEIQAYLTTRDVAYAVVLTDSEFVEDRGQSALMKRPLVLRSFPISELHIISAEED